MGWFTRFWLSPLGKHYDDFAQRYLAYVVSAILIGVLTYAAMHFLGVSHFPGYYKTDVLYHHRYALETALNFGFWLYLVEEWLSRVPVPWAIRKRWTVGAICLLWSCGYLIALVLQLTVIFERIDIYAPKIMHYFDLYPLRRPSLLLRLAIFSAIWFIALNGRILLGLFLQGSAGNKRQKVEINRVQGTAQKPAESDALSEGGISTGATANAKPLQIVNGNAVSIVQPETLAYITSEGHYCRFILQEADKKSEIFTRMALRDVIAELPPDDFIQIHRSHVINKHFIEGLKKSGRSYSLRLNGSSTPLPISRYRWPAVRKHLDPSGPVQHCVSY